MLKQFLAFSLVAVVSSVSFATEEPHSADCLLLQKELKERLSKGSDTSFELKIYESDENVEGKEVGTCRGGAMKIMYVEVDPS